ncbi:FMN-dependent NADH-azoreductase [Pseudoalteromonas sp. MEBiC 03607]|uniref:FMN-dependent NADH-azoreductase n=1 Tax=unclassified Pseudoalteromonas TaxID=194690 RepID=UPI0010936242|nr:MULTISPECIES: NAD(P)H-dependent oxidoreductase [unclassified Pseudoalteromonas]MCF2899888.1 NAD(P)H-dependent oxidoreductase [Pseudoalteromonas sp. OFAV1]TGV21103.1 FMN-dependent NADH-azoreductase [Pseudoalteromonas sp. MEBiC 03607]TMO40217.1 FMN-dependent NADH-azoreductase [Pseudoalteromonas sp. S4389]
MKKVLVLNSSLNGEQGNSTKLSQQFVEQLANNQQISVTTRDLSDNAIAHLTQTEMAAWMTDANERNDEQKALAAISDDLIAELNDNELIVIGMPMYNFGIPSTFKAWIDRIARAGITFKYTEQGPVGLVEGKKVVVLAARGGIYQGTDMDTQTKYLKDVLGFVGMTDVHFIYAEGLAMPDAEQSLEAAKNEINTFAAAL